MRLTLLHKGLLLISIPLLFEVSIFGVLINLQNQAEQEAQRVNRNKRINDAVNRILQETMYLGQGNTLLHLRGFNAAKFLQNIDDVRKNFNELDDLTSYDPELNRTVKYCKLSMDKALEDLHTISRALHSAPQDELPGMVEQAQDRLDVNLRNVLSAGFLSLAEKSRDGSNDEKSQKLRQKIRLLLEFAIGLSILVALLGATMYSKHLVSRLRRLTTNADHLAKHEPLLPIQGGGDEVAELEKSFHYAADLVYQAALMRREVTAMISHDLKNPLQSILSVFEMLQSGRLGDVSEQAKTMISLSEKEAARMTTLIDSVLQLEKIRSKTLSLKLTSSPVGELLDRSCDAVQLFADEKSVSIRREYQHSDQNVQLEQVECDRFWIEQVFVNLLSNAVKFSPNKSSVSVTIQLATAVLTVRISDRGPGIPKTEFKSIFERFHRVSATANDVGGTGLGLSIAKELVELHQGTIEVESQLGQGSTFIVRLPRAKAQQSST